MYASDPGAAGPGFAPSVDAPPAARSDPDAVCGVRLLAARLAGAAFDGAYNLRSVTLDALLRERAHLRRSLGQLRQPLVNALHDAIPAVLDAAQRREMLRLKRDVFNGRQPGPLPDGLPPRLAARAAEYARLAAREAALLDDGRAAVVNEGRARVAALLKDPRFRLACAHVSPDLREELERGASPTGPALTSLERGVAAYAVRFISKANPLHLFGRVLLPPSTGQAPAAPYEAVLDMGAVLALERARLDGPRKPAPVRLSLCTHICSAGAYSFWVPSPEGFRVVRLHAVPPLQALDAFLATRGPTASRQAAEAHLVALGMDAPGAVAFLDRLVARGVAREHLVDDFGAFAEALAHGGDELQAQAARVQRWHLAPLDAEGLARAAAALDGERLPDGAPIRYYVNAYARGSGAPHEQAAAEVAADIRVVAPCFRVEHNFSAHGYVVRALVAEMVDARGGGEVPYLDVLRRYIGERDELLARLHPAAHRPPAERRRRDAFLAAAAALEGEASGEALAVLAAAASELAPPAPLCFNGPFDYAERVYHVQNIFAGGGRFTARYQLNRRVDPAPPSPDGAVDVEIALAPHPNMNYVVRRHAAGCGFDTRYAARYERWVGPADVLLGLDGGEVAYRHMRTGERLRFHHTGFMLGQFLPAEYQLLLAGHADAYRNPFDMRAVAPGGAGVAHRPGLRYGAVQLRREQWSLGRAALAPLVAEADPVRGAAWLRDWVYLRLHEADLWYYRVGGTGTNAHKPRLLDLLNPFTVLALRRELAAAPERAAVTFTRMEPGPDGLFTHEGGAYVVELMIEA